jgi:sugar transferase (PEP-CTERM/EpsH1 system associated)
MRLLFLTPRLPYPPNRGGEITIFNFLRVLSRRHEVALVSFYDAPHELNYRQELVRYCVKVEMVQRARKFDLSVLSRWAFLNQSYAMARHASPDFSAAIRRVLSAWPADVAQLETFFMGQYLKDLHRIATVLDMHNVTWLMWDRLARVAPLWLKYPIAIEARRIRRDELEVCRAVDVCAPVSDSDLVELTTALGTPPRAVVVTPGVDCDLLTPVGHSNSGSNLVFVGSMSYAPNIDAVEYFCHEILPRVAADAPDVTLTIVGARPAPAVTRLANDPRVQVTGFVDDVKPYYAAASASIVPLRVAGGIRMKILESMALGSPLVSTSIGAEGLGLIHGRDLLIADSPDTFAAAVVRLLGDEELRRTLARQARETAVQRFSWDAVGATLTGIYESLVSAGGTRAPASVQ